MPHSLIMPKQAGQLDVFYASLEIYYESYVKGNLWCPNSEYKEQIVRKVPRILKDTVMNGPYLVKQSELTRYFGLVYYDYDNNQAKITQRGIEFYKYYKDENLNRQRDLIIYSILHDSFGRGSTAVESSDSDVDPPKLFIKACWDLKGISRKDLAYLIYVCHDQKVSYADSLSEFKSGQDSREINIPANVSNKYSDVKFTVLLVDLGIITQDERKYYLSAYTRNHFLLDITNLSIYNRQPEIIYTMQECDSEIDDIGIDIDTSNTEQEIIQKSFAYDINSAKFISQNNRVPIPYTDSNGVTRYKTNARIAKTALAIADYKCMFAPENHQTFIARTGNQFMEAHHLIPMHAQKDFKVNLDRVENIVCICPNCHSAIHLGNTTERLNKLSELYKQRIDLLRSVGIDISFGDLFNKYYK